MKSKKIGVLLLIIELLFTGCGIYGKNHQDTQEKVELELAVTLADDFLGNAVVDFNKSNEKYEIILRTPDPGENFDDYRNRIHAEISSGKGPDSVSNFVVYTKDGAKHGFLEEVE